MLIQFTVENYLSFDEPTTFSMRAGRDEDHPAHVIGEKVQAVKGAAIYGANAAGKSNLVLAMKFARDLIVKGRSKGQAIAVRPFELSDKMDYERPCGFHWYFRYEGKLWSYGFDVTARRINEEYLVVVDEKGGKEKTWFERKTDKEGNVALTFDPAFKGKSNSKLAQRLEIIEENLRPEQPFLTHAIENKISKLDPVWNWFYSVLTIITAEAKYQPLLPFSRVKNEFLQFASGFLHYADTGIECLTNEFDEFQEQSFLKHVPPEFRELLLSQINDIKPDDAEFWNFGYMPMGIYRGKDNKLWSINLKARHRTLLGEERYFELNCESEGTQRLIHLLPVLYELKTDQMVLVIDEVDRRLHSKLTRRFIEMALGPGSLPENQFIFTTHDTNLLDSSLLRRDEIYFARKRKNQTELERLSEYKIRKDRNYEMAYEEGRVGGGGPRLSDEMYALMEEDDEGTKEEIAHASA